MGRPFVRFAFREDSSIGEHALDRYARYLHP
jgi:hypothetical protein